VLDRRRDHRQRRLAVFELIRSWRRTLHLRPARTRWLGLAPAADRGAQSRARLAAAPPHPGIALNTPYVGHGDIVYQQPCKLGCERIVSKRLGSLLAPAAPGNWSRSRIRQRRRFGARRRKEENWGPDALGAT
jgi:hypothetical protein